MAPSPTPHERHSRRHMILGVCPALSPGLACRSGGGCSGTAHALLGRRSEHKPDGIDISAERIHRRCRRCRHISRCVRAQREKQTKEPPGRGDLQTHVAPPDAAAQPTTRKRHRRWRKGKSKRVCQCLSVNLPFFSVCDPHSWSVGPRVSESVQPV